LLSINVDFYAAVLFLLVVCTSLPVTTSHFHSPVAFFLHISCFTVFITGESN